MFARIVQNKAWPEIEDAFTEIFDQRTKGGLTSVYYRIRKNWVCNIRYVTLIEMLL